MTKHETRTMEYHPSCEIRWSIFVAFICPSDNCDPIAVNWILQSPATCSQLSSFVDQGENGRIGKMVFARNVTLYGIRIHCYRFTIRIRHHINLVHIIEHGSTLYRFKENRHRSDKWIFELVRIDPLKCSIGRWTLYDNGIMHVLFTKEQWIGCKLRREFAKRNPPETRCVQKWKYYYLPYSRREWVKMTPAITSHCHQQSQTYRS